MVVLLKWCGFCGKIGGKPQAFEEPLAFEGCYGISGITGIAMMLESYIAPPSFVYIG